MCVNRLAVVSIMLCLLYPADVANGENATCADSDFNSLTACLEEYFLSDWFPYKHPQNEPTTTTPATTPAQSSTGPTPTGPTPIATTPIATTTTVQTPMYNGGLELIQEIMMDTQKDCSEGSNVTKIAGCLAGASKSCLKRLPVSWDTTGTPTDPYKPLILYVSYKGLKEGLSTICNSSVIGEPAYKQCFLNKTSAIEACLTNRTSSSETIKDALCQTYRSSAICIDEMNECENKNLTAGVAEIKEAITMLIPPTCAAPHHLPLIPAILLTAFLPFMFYNTN